MLCRKCHYGLFCLRKMGVTLSSPCGHHRVWPMKNQHRCLILLLRQPRRKNSLGFSRPGGLGPNARRAGTTHGTYQTRSRLQPSLCCQPPTLSHSQWPMLRPLSWSALIAGLSSGMRITLSMRGKRRSNVSGPRRSSCRGGSACPRRRHPTIRGTTSERHVVLVPRTRIEGAHEH